ncbi:MAG: AzlC family ABC transporter permease [Candidatus Thioglobus sp.]|jgi:4-azaleucine resistance transporter AzlC|nr:AzlC family ABC transporter permease [Candidatus Pseudothioglobus aerophilus]MBT3440083.1 AzlC family ABC transporter permease [Gammaproteobacteria bacterium]MBT4244602.1 AzlC family ABC transporter permease [Gammaproteobacteria bacterium]MBT4587522.1 AzlC family ABC transporter permease [Gammaproteobacteria bacterium]MBT5408174.1 AzlC family ABC transporter permease [Gammaproteobacteria bacterium]
MIRSALTISLPILFGFVPLGIAFGLLFQELGYPWYFASLMAVFVYAGAAQFMAIGLLSSGIGLLEIAISTFFLNSRHMFYGLAFLQSFGNWNLRKLYLIFGLTDETYALMTTIKVPKNFTKERYYFFITLFAQLYWVLGCTIGALAANALSFNTSGMEFAATALFVVLLIEQWVKVKRLLPFVIAFIASAIALLFFIKHMLLVAIILSIASIVLFRLFKIQPNE